MPFDAQQLMRQRRPRGARQVSTTESLPAPVGGWNARDALGEMNAVDAVVLTNLVPYPTWVALRQGYTNYATGLGGQVNTVMGYSGPSMQKMFGASGANIYDVTAGGAVGAAVQSGLTNDQWQFVNFENTGGAYLYLVNGADAPRYFDGAAWTSPSITGVTAANLVHVNSHKGRLWFVEKNTLNAWYLAPAAISGAATQFNLSGIAQRGGYLQAMGTWTLDAGYGIDDYAVFVTSNGEVIVYRGTDPTSATTWSLVGVWWLGSPIGRRCLMKYKGDLLIITQDGLYPLSGYLQSSRLDPKVALTNKIEYAVSVAVSLYAANFGWQVQQFPAENLLILNVPIALGQQQQYVMSTLTGTWCNFTGWNANCWELWKDGLYFGGNGVVGKAWSGFSDNGNNVVGLGTQAFNYFNSPGRQKRFTMMRPVIQTNGYPGVSANMNVDFNLQTTLSPISIPPSVFGVWDSGLWNSAIWSPGVAVQKAWQGATGVGYCGAPQIQIASNSVLAQWIETDVVFEVGGVL
jgi:hypothetical protein